MAVGALFGFVLAFSFMVSGYSGAEPLMGRLPAFAALGLVGAACGVLLGLLGAILGKTVRRSSKRKT